MSLGNYRYRLWLGISSSMLVGAFVGGIEAISTLAGSDFGEYDAIFWGVSLYSVIGFVVGIPIGILLMANVWLRSFSKNFVWSCLFWLCICDSKNIGTFP